MRISLVLKVLDGRQIDGDGDVYVSGVRIPEYYQAVEN